ncbi:hypothetical protein F5Y13DRAFT_194433 [Hypoxylon sp. FL1857]|nr:hypothetical protein F5Y13DRAFT_194433 [Hypoxylon sp. FL1857]
MPKLINSASYELGLAKGKIEELTTRQHELEAEILRLKAHIKKYNLPLPRSESPRSSTKSPGLNRNFLKPTAASLNRSIQPPRQETPENTEAPATTIKLGYLQYAEYRDGALVELSNPNNNFAHFRYPTASSEMKRRPRINSFYVGSDTAVSDYDSYSDDTPQYEAPAWWLPEQLRALELEKKSPANAMKDALSERSRLKDHIPARLKRVPIRSHILIDHLWRALHLAQDIFFYGCKKHFPRAVEGMQGPREVRWGRDEMMHGFFFRIGSEGLDLAGTHYSRNDLESHFDDITLLRNTICHFKTSDMTRPLFTYDSFFRSVQYLAVIFGDERRVFKARAYRDKLVRQAEKSLQEIEALGVLAELPQARPWEIHHIEAFDRIIDMRYDDTEEMENCTPEFLRAARAWDLQRTKPTNGDWLPKSLREWDWPLDTALDKLTQDESSEDEVIESEGADDEESVPECPPATEMVEVMPQSE